MMNDKVELAWQLVEHTGANIFISGKAGTGKTTFLKRLREESAKSIIVLAPTGIAALNAGGMTIHSFFQFSFSPYIPGIGQTEGTSRFKRYSKEKIKLIRAIDTIVIDEISMVRADVLDAIDAKLRQLRNPALPFGGVQLVMIGDMQQLPPVVKEEEWQILREHYTSPYFFHSHVLCGSHYETIEFTKVYRQKDSGFINILNAIRENRADRTTLDVLNSRYIAGFNPPESERYIRLMTHNYQANLVNEEKMKSLPGEAHTFDAIIDGDFPELIYPAEGKLVLKEGAQVMFVKNDSSGERRYYNGLIGKVINISKSGKVTVAAGDDATHIEVTPEIWENTSYSVDEKDKKMTEKVIGRFSQLPLRAAWAITIHKSQGLTFDKAIINASGAFAHGQTYVALSRCRSLEGLVLESPLPASSIICDRTVTEFETACHSREADDTSVTLLHNEFEFKTDLEIPSLSGLGQAMESLHRAMQESHAKAFPKLTAQFGELYHKKFKELNDVSMRFQEQLRRMADGGATPGQIHDRLKASCTYFLKELDPVFKFMEDIPREVDNKEALKKFSEAITLVEFECRLKETLMKETLEKKIPASDFIRIKREVALSPSEWAKSVNKNKSHKVKAGSDIENPELYEKLTEWRKSKAEQENVPVYVILGNKTLVVLSNEMPENEEDLLTVPGIGKKKKADYGADLIEIIRKYRL